MLGGGGRRGSRVSHNEKCASLTQLLASSYPKTLSTRQSGKGWHVPGKEPQASDGSDKESGKESELGSPGLAREMVFQLSTRDPSLPFR